MPLRPFSPAASARRGAVFIRLFQSMLTCDLEGQVDGDQLSLPEYRCACVHACFCARAIEFLCVCVRSLCTTVRVWQHFLTYILLSTINCKEICVNQLPLWPACLLPLAGWLSRSADLIKTKETISSDFHFHELHLDTPPQKIYSQFGHFWPRMVFRG